mgnify:CR=1 FL=1
MEKETGGGVQNAKAERLDQGCIQPVQHALPRLLLG